MRRYKLLRTWSVILAVVGGVAFVAGGLGVVWWVFAVEGFWQSAAAIAIGAPIAVLLGLCPIALGLGLRALADIGEDLAWESLTTAASSPY
jgi:hypothetical protein